MDVTVDRTQDLGPASGANAKNAAATDAGHRVLPGIGDVVIEAWAPTRPACLELAARAVLECAGRPARGRTRQIERHVPAGDDRRVLTDVLHVVLDVRGTAGLPVHDVTVVPEAGGAVRLVLAVGEACGGRRTPRRVAPQWVSIWRSGPGWRCEATLDR